MLENRVKREQMEKVHSEEFLRKRKMMLVLPALMLPFIMGLFWALGGGKGSDAMAQSPSVKSGLNLELPTANLKDDAGWTKMDYYRQADEDSARRLEQIKRDPYYNLPMMAAHVADTNPLMMIKDRAVTYQQAAPKSVFSGGTPEEARDAALQQKMRDLDQQLKTGNTRAYTASSAGDGPKPRKRGNRVSIREDVEEDSELSPEIRQMRSMMADMEAGSASEPDSEIKELSGMINKLTDLQFPERVREKIKAESEKSKGKVFAVQLAEDNNVSFLEAPSDRNASASTWVDTGNHAAYAVQTVNVSTNGFYGLEDDNTSLDATANTIPAVMHETQTLVNGATVKLRLLQDVYINGVEVPANSFIYGQAQLTGERLGITITSIRSGNNILPVMLAVYDLDGLAGVSIPGAITRDVAKQSADQSIQQLGLNSMDPSLGVQAASAGIELGKNLLTKKVKLIKVTVKAGYQVLLKDNQTKSS